MCHHISDNRIQRAVAKRSYETKANPRNTICFKAVADRKSLVVAFSSVADAEQPQRGSNPCLHLERVMS